MDACLLDSDPYEGELMELMPHQEQALEFLDNGKILYGITGSGKSLVAIAYYMKRESHRDIYIITTAKKRDSLDWLGEAARFGVGPAGASVAGALTIDSWNNLHNYTDVQDAFFIFDEQRVVGHGTWVKSFLKITKKNRWILLTATPGDNWLDYAPVFIANGWYKNITDFKFRHVRLAPYLKYEKVIGYYNEERLERLRNEILVEMPYLKHTTRILNYMDVEYDEELVGAIVKNRWNVLYDHPIQDAAELWRLMRRIVYSDPSRLEMVRKIMQCHDKLIIFYNFDYELEILRTLGSEITVAEWNGHRHMLIPNTDKWVYLVQYMAGAEGWNCTDTSGMLLYSLTYSYKNFFQAQGRIDRLNTSYTDLYYYILISDAYVDIVVKRALEAKRSFNENSGIESWKIRGFPANKNEVAG
jgi:superfamily II DNA or RNA helicase